MGYQNIKDVLSQYGSTLNKTEEDYMGHNSIGMEYDQQINPYTSRGYVDQSYRGLASEKEDIYSPMEMYEDGALDPTLLTRATQGLTYASIASKASPYIEQGINQGLKALGGKAVPGGTPLNYAGPAALYGMTRNNNPYDYTSTEALGTTGATMWAANTTAMHFGAKSLNPWVMLGSYLLSRWFNKKGIKKAKKLVGKEYDRIRDFQTEQAEGVEERFVQSREDALAKQNASYYDQMANQYTNQYGSYADPYASNYEEGGKITKQDLQEVKKLGRHGDTELVHVNQQEKQMLKNMGGSGTINPYTGLEEYHFSLSHITDPINDVVGGAFDVVGGILDPVLGAAGDVVNTAGGVATDVIDTVVDTGVDVIKTGGDIATDVLQDVGNFVEPIIRPPMELAGEIVDDVIELLTPESFDMPDFDVSDRENPDMSFRDPKAIKKNQLKGERQTANVKFDQNANVKDSKATNELTEFKWDLDNPYITEEVEQFSKGGKAEAVSDDVLSNYMDQLKDQENSSLVGYNKEDGKFYPIPASEGDGSMEIGYGFKLPADEMERLSKEGMTMKEAEAYMRQDLQKRMSSVKDYFDKNHPGTWDSLPDKVKIVAADYEYNLRGGIGSYPKFAKALAENDYDGAESEYVRNMRKDGKLIPLGKRNDWTVETLFSGAPNDEQLWDPNNPNIEWHEGDTNPRAVQDAMHGNEDYVIDQQDNTEVPAPTNTPTPTEFAQGGRNDIIAEFTGNELIVNNQDLVEEGLSEGNYTKAAAPIKQAISNNYITPGEETHKGNPIPVDADGNIYAGGGKLKFKVGKGAGVYDHADEQFKSGMTDKEIAMIAQENINKWKSNNMYS
jgi:GH24 family phage-related lysozyme (muramidase)